MDLANLDVDLALEVLGVVSEYLLTDLKFFIERYIIATDAVDDENVFFVLEVSDHYNARELRYHCVGIIAEHVETWDREGDQRSTQVAALPHYLRRAIKER